MSFETINYKVYLLQQAIVGITVGGVVILGAGGFSIFRFAVKKKTFADLLKIFKRK